MLHFPGVCGGGAKETPCHFHWALPVCKALTLIHLISANSYSDPVRKGNIPLSHLRKRRPQRSSVTCPVSHSKSTTGQGSTWLHLIATPALSSHQLPFDYLRAHFNTDLVQGSRNRGQRFFGWHFHKCLLLSGSRFHLNIDEILRWPGLWKLRGHVWKMLQYRGRRSRTPTLKIAGRGRPSGSDG